MKLFTPQEAQDALGVVRPLVEALVSTREGLRDPQGELEAVRAKVTGNGGGFEPGRVAALAEAAAAAAERLAEIATELEELGVQVKDLDRGLVDFPARHPRSEEIVLLCWHVGEDEVRYWHGAEEGFAGRKPLPF